MDDDDDHPRDARGGLAGDRGDPPAITPDDEPSALARGIRIFERLNRGRQAAPKAVPSDLPK